ncbi:MAG: hypothetical protein ABWY64_06335 [Tardiphaga sp.]
MTDGTEDYRVWKAGVTTELQRLHGISAGIIPEHVWTRLYVKGMTPEDAANAPEVYNYYTRST